MGGGSAENAGDITEYECLECQERRSRSFVLRLDTESLSSKVGIVRIISVILNLKKSDICLDFHDVGRCCPFWFFCYALTSALPSGA
jgi:hypothetical protein